MALAGELMAKSIRDKGIIEVLEYYCFLDHNLLIGLSDL
jgi:hypothetical protein